jgi:hypothetical protein
MKNLLLTLNAALLFACVSMYFGTGWSIALFSIPVIPQFTPENYYYAFVPEVANATAFFTIMTQVMIVCGLIMIVAEWKTNYRWLPIIVLLLVIASTALTVYIIFPINKEMADGIKTATALQQTFASWKFLTEVRVAIWSLQWTSMMLYFGLKANAAAGAIQ